MRAQYEFDVRGGIFEKAVVDIPGVCNDEAITKTLPEYFYFFPLEARNTKSMVKYDVLFQSLCFLPFFVPN